ncbi:MAG: hypothetical protein LBM72_03070 [Mycoplasmataceae bacterium]|jgi:hypothetical protein|nr:hypothetical protein [Mycoplasmataceae bacterium]
MDINKEQKDIIARSEGELATKKIEIEELKTERDQAIAKAHADYELVVVEIDQHLIKDLAEIDRLKRAAEEKKKLAIADAKVHLQRVLDSIEAKY